MERSDQRAAAGAALSVVIPTLNAAAGLPTTLACLNQRAAGDLALEVIVSDGGSRDDTRALATAAGAKVLDGPVGRGPQLAAGAAAAGHDWLLFLHADTWLARGWDVTAQVHMASVGGADRAGVFRFALNDRHPAARRLEKIVAWRNAWLGLPYGDQGLLIHRRLYDAVGGYRPLPLMEDVDLVRRLGMRRLVAFDVAAVTDAARYRRDGYGPRMRRNAVCLALYFLGVPPHRLVPLYRGRR